MDQPAPAPAPAAPEKPEARREHYWLKALALVAILGGLGLLLWQTGLLRFFMEEKRLEGFIKRLGFWGWAGFVLLQASQVIMAPIPGEATGVLGGYLYGPVLGVALSTLGLTLGSLAAFGLARFFGRPLVDHFVAPKTMERFDYLLHHKGTFLVLLLFLLPGFPKDVFCYILGLSHLKWLEFLLVAGLGRILGTVLLTLGGAFIREKQYGHLFILAGVAVVIVGLGFAYRDKLERLFHRLKDRGTN